MKFGVNVPEMHTGRASFLKLGHPQHFLSSNRYIYPLFPTPVAKNPPSNKRTAILCSATIRDAVAEDISVDSGGSPLQVSNAELALFFVSVLFHHDIGQGMDQSRSPGVLWDRLGTSSWISS